MATKRSCSALDQPQIETSQAGILPVTPDKLYSRSPYTRGRGRAGPGWKLVANGVKRESCGTYKMLDGCLNHRDHPDGKVLIRRVHMHCNSLACPICATHAMSRAADRIKHRLESWWFEHPRWSGHRIKPIHVIVSPPTSEVERLKGNYPRLRDLCTKQALKAGLIGGVVIPHPYRHAEYGDELPEGFDIDKIQLAKGWYESWHFHIIGFGWIDHEYQDNGWIVKNLGVRGDSPEEHRIFELARYQLSHCGVHEKYNSFTWIGELSTRRYKAPPMPRAPAQQCPACGGYLYPVAYDGPLPDEIAREQSYWVDPPGWRYVTRNHRGGSGDEL